MTDSEAPDPFGYYRAVFDDALADLALGAAVEAALARALDGLCSTLVQAEDGPVPDGSFDYIPISLPNLLRDLAELDALLVEDPDYACKGVRYRPVRFLEVGCGIGRNLAMLRHGNPLDWAELKGFDIQAPLVEAGRRAFGGDMAVADAMDWDYGAHDVVFSYRPFRDDDRQRAYEAVVEAGMRVGAYLLSPLAMNAAPSRRMLAVGRSGNLWKKIA